MNDPVPPGEPGRVVGPGFHRQVFEVVCRVPPGRVTTYGDVAKALGSVRVARHVGYALAALDDPEVPWHRVINGRGRISFPLPDLRGAEQRARLEAEGVEVDDEGRVEGFGRLRVEGSVLQG